jgi:ectoine hydroxylase-related dioxygenase (phytanoyl-CoA dioxygenase family)
MPNVLSQAKVKEVCNMIDETVKSPITHDGIGNGKAIDHLKCVFNRDPYWLQYLDYAGIIDAVEDLMGKDSHIIGMTAWRSPPNVGGKFIHIDQIFTPMEESLLLSGKVHLPVFISTLHFYLNDMDIDLCPTWVVPGSHKSGRSPNQADSRKVGDEDIYSWNGIDEQPVLVNAGDAMLFRSEVWHGGSKNSTKDRTRYLLQVHYARRGIAQRFPPYLEFKYNQDVLDKATERQLRLLGKHNIGAYG